MANYTNLDNLDISSLPEKDQRRILRITGMVKGLANYTDGIFRDLWNSLTSAGNSPDNPYGIAPNAAAEASSALISFHLSSAVKLAVIHTGVRLNLGNEIEDMEKLLEQPAAALAKIIGDAMEDFQKQADKIALSRN